MPTVLIVEDEPHVVRVLRLALEREGYRVESVTNGEAALASIEAAPPDLLITDLQMPRMGGDELCRTLHEQLTARQFPILVSTSRPETEHRQWSREIPNLTFLEKPLSIRKLLARLALILPTSS